MEKTTSYLIRKLEEGKNLDIIILSHNACWPEIQNLDNHFENCNVMFFGETTSDLKLANNQQIENCDLIILYSSETYNEAELIDLKNIAYKISNDKNKRVSIGYSYYIPVEQRPYENISKQIKIVSFKNAEEVIEDTYPTPYFTAYDLIELTLATADNYDIGSTKVKK